MTSPREPVPGADTAGGGPKLCRECEARHRGICGVLTGEELALFNKHAVQKSVPKGTAFLSLGQVPEFHANVLEGVIKLSKTLQDGRQQIVGLQFAPDFLGRAWGEESPVSAEAVTDVRLCRFPRDLVERMMSTIHRLEHRVFEQVLLQLDLARDWILTLGQKTAGEKVASFLLLIATHRDPLPSAPNKAGHVTFELPLSRSDIADFLGLKLETVSRQLSKLRELDVIRIEHNRTVIVLDRGRLLELSGP